MKLNLENFCKQAADAIDPEKDHYAYAWMLREEIPRLINEVKSGKATLQEFGECFCIVEKPHA